MEIVIHIFISEPHVPEKVSLAKLFPKPKFYHTNLFENTFQRLQFINVVFADLYLYTDSYIAWGNNTHSPI
jgi:hypothetical protein